MKIDPKLFKSYWFILGLSLLLINDFILKELFHNWFTGKLSDFAGLFIFPLFWATIFPKHKTKIFCLTGLLFVFWKSNFSQFLIDSWNNLDLFRVRRVVDYSDLIALLVLPISFGIEKKKVSLKQVKISPIIPATLSILSFLATSYSTDLKVDKEYTFDFPLQTLKKKIYYLSTIYNVNTQQHNGYILDSTGKFWTNKYSEDTIPAKDSIELFVKDSVELFVRDDFCFNGYEAILLLSGDSLQSKIMLTGFHHSCPEDGKFILPFKQRDDIKILSKSFENKVIEELKK